MSGGSFNYLYLADLSNVDCDVERMVAKLRELGHEDAAARTEEVMRHLRAASAIQVEMREVWRDVEWIDSGDCSRGEELESVEAWRRDGHAVAQALKSRNERSER